MTKLYEVLNLIEEVLKSFNPIIRVIEHYVSIDDQVEYINVKVNFPEINAILMIRQYWRGRTLVAYGYYVRVEDYEEWWDNRPHHPEIQTYPHHRHLGDKVQPLPNYSLKSFLIRAKELLKQ